jgi:anthranilate synthase component 1
MTEAEFTRLAAAGFNRIRPAPRACADLETPIPVYLVIANSPHSYRLESVTRGRIVRAGRVALRKPSLIHQRAPAIERAPFQSESVLAGHGHDLP